MEATNGYIDHIGLVSAIHDHQLRIHLIDKEGCSSCSMKSYCGEGDEDRKVFNVEVPDDQFHVGDEVVLRLRSRTGFKALFWGYMFPFLLVIGVLQLTMTLGLGELLSGSVALATLVPYYLTLVLLRDVLKKQLNLEVRKR